MSVVPVTEECECESVCQSRVVLYTKKGLFVSHSGSFFVSHSDSKMASEMCCVTSTKRVAPRVAIVGSQSFTDYDVMKRMLSNERIGRIVSGGAKGADTLVERYAAEMNIDIDVLVPKWTEWRQKHPDAFKNRAGIERNIDIIEASEVVYTFWDGKSLAIQSARHKRTRRRSISIGKTIRLENGEKRTLVAVLSSRIHSVVTSYPSSSSIDLSCSA